MGGTCSVCNIRNSGKRFDRAQSPWQQREKISRSLDMSTEEIDIVQKTWPIIAKDLKETGLQVFLKIFDMCPEIKKSFSLENVPSSELSRNAFIKAHGTRVMTTISAAVEGFQDIGRNNNSLCKLLTVLGQQHKRHNGFRPEFFEIFYESLMWQWERCLGYAFTPEVSDTWSHLFVFIMVTLEEGCNTPDMK
jgi:hemoglobin-like flavoprotein